MIQGFYGNRTITETTKEEIGWLLLGWIGDDGVKFGKLKDGDRYAIKKIEIPNTDYMMVYNPIVEEEVDKEKRNPWGYIPSLGIEIYSRCLICRRGNDGDYKSLEVEDYEKVKEYMAE